MAHNVEVSERKSKEPYNPPRLISYGDLPGMTQAKFTGTNADHKGKGAGKT
jgi:hypothetical protein